MEKKRKIIVFVLLVISIITILTVTIIVQAKNKDARELVASANELDNEANNEIIETENILTNEVLEETEQAIANEEQPEESETSSDNTQSTVKKNENKEKAPTKQTETTTTKPNAEQKKPESSNSNGTTKPAEKPTEKPVEKPTEKPVEKPVRCTTNSNHGIGVGNCGKWYVSKSEGISEYDSKQSYWGEQMQSEKITWEEYLKKCPSGYEYWSCMFCGKWTLNYYYR